MNQSDFPSNTDLEDFLKQYSNFIFEESMPTNFRNYQFLNPLVNELNIYNNIRNKIITYETYVQKETFFKINIEHLKNFAFNNSIIFNCVRLFNWIGLFHQVCRLLYFLLRKCNDLIISKLSNVNILMNTLKYKKDLTMQQLESFYLQTQYIFTIFKLLTGRINDTLFYQCLINPSCEWKYIEENKQQYVTHFSFLSEKKVAVASKEDGLVILELFQTLLTKYESIRDQLPFNQEKIDSDKEKLDTTDKDLHYLILEYEPKVEPKATGAVEAKSTEEEKAAKAETGASATEEETSSTEEEKAVTAETGATVEEETSSSVDTSSTMKDEAAEPKTGASATEEETSSSVDIFSTVEDEATKAADATKEDEATEAKISATKKETSTTKGTEPSATIDVEKKEPEPATESREEEETVDTILNKATITDLDTGLSVVSKLLTLESENELFKSIQAYLTVVRDNVEIEQSDFDTKLPIIIQAFDIFKTTTNIPETFASFLKTLLEEINYLAAISYLQFIKQHDYVDLAWFQKIATNFKTLKLLKSFSIFQASWIEFATINEQITCINNTPLNFENLVDHFSYFQTLVNKVQTFENKYNDILVNKPNISTIQSKLEEMLKDVTKFEFIDLYPYCSQTLACFPDFQAKFKKSVEMIKHFYNLLLIYIYQKLIDAKKQFAKNDLDAFNNFIDSTCDNDVNAKLSSFLQAAANKTPLPVTLLKFFSTASPSQQKPKGNKKKRK